MKVSIAETPKAPRRPGPSLGMAIALMVAGTAIAIPTFIAGFAPIVRTMRTPVRFDAPGVNAILAEAGQRLNRRS